MISIVGVFGMILTVIVLMIGCAFGGLWLGAYIHHRGVSIGSGNRETFTGMVPKGEVFRMKEADGMATEPEVFSEIDKTIAARADRFLNAVMGGKG